MSTLTERPIVKSIAEDSLNKNAPSQTEIGEGIEYASLLSSPETNGFSYILSEAVKNLQRTGGMYSAVIPYSQGQSCSILCRETNQLGIRRFVCASATEITNSPPLTGATITTVNGVSCFAGGVLSADWQDADCIDGYASTPNDVAYNADPATITIPGYAAINVGKRQYVNFHPDPRTGRNPDICRGLCIKAPTLDEVLGSLGRLYYPPFSNVDLLSLLRLGVYNFRGQKVEAFGMALRGQSFDDNGANNSSRFYRSLMTGNAQCVVDAIFPQYYFFTPVGGGTITAKDYRGRVAACDGTPTLSSGTSSARATLGGVQDDQMQLHVHGFTTSQVAGVGVYAAQGGNANASVSTSAPATDGVHGTPRVGYNTREATFTVPVPMVVSLLPYGQITL